MRIKYFFKIIFNACDGNYLGAIATIFLLCKSSSRVFNIYLATSDLLIYPRTPLTNQDPSSYSKSQSVKKITKLRVYQKMIPSAESSQYRIFRYPIHHYLTWDENSRQAKSRSEFFENQITF